MTAGRARSPIRVTIAAAMAAGISVTLALTGHPRAAIGALAAAVLLIVLALLWALRQENRRGA